MQQQTWIITFSGTSATDASQNANELEELLQSAFHDADIIITRSRSKDYTQAFWDQVIAVLNTKAAATFLGKIATFVRRKPLSAKLSMEVRAGQEIVLKAENLTDENFQRTLDQWTPVILRMVDNEDFWQVPMLPAETGATNQASTVLIEEVKDENAEEPDENK